MLEAPDETPWLPDDTPRISGGKWVSSVSSVVGCKTRGARAAMVQQ